MSLKLAAVAAALVASPAFAITTSTFGGAHDPVETAGGVYIGASSILDQFSFTLGSASTLSSNTSSSGITSGMYALFDASNSSLGSWMLGGGPQSVVVGPGSYHYEVTGAAPGLGIYSLASSVSPVPEVGTYALMLAGLAAVGLLARRRA